MIFPGPERFPTRHRKFRLGGRCLRAMIGVAGKRREGGIDGDAFQGLQLVP